MNTVNHFGEKVGSHVQKTGPLPMIAIYSKLIIIWRNIHKEIWCKQKMVNNNERTGLRYWTSYSRTHLLRLWFKISCWTPDINFIVEKFLHDSSKPLFVPIIWSKSKFGGTVWLRRSPDLNVFEATSFAWSEITKGA